MRSIIIILGIASLLSFTSVDAVQVYDSQATSYTVAGCKYSQCKATAKSTGNRCKHCVSNKGDSFCWQHK